MKVAIIPNLTRKNALAVTKEICQWLTVYGAEFAFRTFDRNLANEIPNIRFMEFPELVVWCDAVISVGGDGTMLTCAKSIVDYKKPVLCINAGRLAFMAGLESDELSLLKKLIDGEYTEDHRMLLEVSVYRDGEEVYSNHVINDVVVARGIEMRMCDLDLACDGRHIASYHADGIIVSTPTGSSAYTFSAGGPIIDPQLEGIVVTPISAHSVFSRPIVFNPNNRLTLTSGEEARYTDLLLSVDGEPSVELKKGDIIKVYKSLRYANFIRIKHENFFEILKKKMSKTED